MLYSPTGDGQYYIYNSSLLTWVLKVRQLGPRRNMFDLGMGLSDICSWMNTSWGMVGKCPLIMFTELQGSHLNV